MATHSAIATMGIKQPLGLIQVPTISPTGDEVRVRVEWTASTPLDLHQNDGGLLVKHPQVLGDGIAGTVVEVGPLAKRLRVGDGVFGFVWRESKEKAHQEFCTTNEWLLAKIPDGFAMAEAVTLPNNFVTVFHAVTTDLGIELPWPKPVGHVPRRADDAILIWGGSSSVGQFAIQILKCYGHANILTTASKKHHQKLLALGAKAAFDYSAPDVVGEISQAGPVPFILDCIGSQKGSMAPLSRIATKGAKVAVLLPVIVRDSSDDEDPIYSMDVAQAVAWDEGVDARGVRTHFYLEPDVMPTMLRERLVEPNRQRVIEGATLLERAQAAMDALRRKEASGERLVWRVSEA
ncbi:GroES-like protein [Corynespora cassiicola Philippines]|uniref:GroES-like protein n=1 Tax=Corynespora cassiicola Philippines TaxID=1448308 RepID=A0A2T2NA18_CORCC|nr:GroES-like protein [Corynespora cassiicola Philippines]